MLLYVRQVILLLGSSSQDTCERLLDADICEYVCEGLRICASLPVAERPGHRQFILQTLELLGHLAEGENHVALPHFLFALPFTAGFTIPANFRCVLRCSKCTLTSFESHSWVCGWVWSMSAECQFILRLSKRFSFVFARLLLVASIGCSRPIMYRCSQQDVLYEIAG